MPKFHDEFFKKGSSKHDDMVIKILQSEDIITDKFLPKSSEKDVTLFICNPEENDNCTLESRIISESVQFCEECRYNDHEKLKHGETKTGSKPVVCLQKRTVSLTGINKETEKICKVKNGFIIGYCDVVYEIHYNIKTQMIIEKDWVWEYGDNNYDKTIVIDAKPEMKSWGGPLRQIKTYMDCLRAHYGVLVSYDDISEDHKIHLLEEKVIFIKLDEPEVTHGGTLTDYS